ncbi:MAG: 5'/3'-nucleotidase SurE [Acidimicrobiia bacterium]|nr:5'/3'-nucleotidase SurE [Acidimicrobiia bacterium]
MTRRLLALLCVLMLAAASCGSDSETSTADDATDEAATSTSEPDSGSTTTAAPATSTEAPAPTEAPTTTVAAETLRIVVANDDGVGAPGIDALAVRLGTLENVEVVIVAPAEERSGSGGQVTGGPVDTTDATTASGLEATAVDGFPADAVVWALDNIEPPPHVVVSGSNSVQNIGPLQAVSGTVGAARQAAQLGVPGVAVSQGLADPVDYAASVDAAVEWIETHRDEYLAGEVTLFSINAPTCPEGTQGVIEVPWGPEWNDRDGEVDCDSDLEVLTDDIDAFLNGWTSISELPIENPEA